MLLRKVVRAYARLRTRTYTAGSLVYIQSKDGYVLFVRGRLSRKWTLPGGFNRRREFPKDTAIREVFEETGLDVSPYLQEVGEYRQAHQPHYDHIFLADLARPSNQIPISPAKLRGKLEIAHCEWRDIRNVEHRTEITPEATHALDLIKRKRGYEL